MNSIIPYADHVPKLQSSVFVADGARVIGNVEIGGDCGIWFNAVLRGDVNYIRIAERTNIQDNVTVHVTSNDYPVNVGSNNTIGHGAILHGCTIGNYNLIGMGSTILDGAMIGNYCMVAAGALVLEGFKVPDGMLVAGLPARIKRALTNEEKIFFEQSAQHYVQEAKKYQTK